MKNISTILSIVALVATGVLFFLFFTHQEDVKKRRVQNDAVLKRVSAGNTTIAYFEMDSVENNFLYVKDAMDKMKEKEASMNSQLQNLQGTYQRRIAEWNKKGQTMTQSESENVQREYAQMNETYQKKKQELEMEMQDLQFKTAQEVNKTIEDYLKKYNQNKGFSYIMTSQPGLIYYKDTVHNITADLIAGLNEEYKNKKK